MAVLNLRPLAGGRILRGSQPFGLDAAATSNFLAEHGIQAIVDLRSELERSLVPWMVQNNNDGVGVRAAVVPPAVELIHNPLDPNAIAGSLQSVETPQDLGELYLGWIRLRPEWVADALRPVARGKRTLVHCSLGKDRTGVVSAIALLASGGTEDQVVADYAATTANLPDVLEVMAETWRLSVPATPAEYFSPELMILQSPEAAMQHFLAGFAQEFGDARSFLREAGLTAVEVESLAL
ncbi:tyrosine-protein phosphatase [Paenarthrobacter sp. TYUT067]|uniref:tyrosine-protein phosphatase n=1 Tax=Paenarthrobacter sp. TYUT067 TaxID=2926245 RepID=UPI00202E59DA|nr:tyrosine-protein phosphatase [Paenarthrobacter sp. TYUT067]MCM0617865.1 tyrosine-protein phosphatase [Paenarthrobacter sp. TYUT067]